MILNFAGVAIYELWGLDAAQRCSKPRFGSTRACRTRAEISLARRRGDGARGGRAAAGPRDAHSTGAREQVAARARPATGMTLSLCMIVRDEEEMLPRCLAAAAPAVDELIVVDTGSPGRDDRDRPLVRRAGDRVRLDRLVLRCAQRLLRCGDRATG